MSVLKLEGGVPTLDYASLPAGHDAASIGETVAAFREFGCVRVLGAFSPELIGRLNLEHERRNRRYFPEARYYDARWQGDRRTLITLDISGPFNAPEFYASPALFPLVSAILGPDCILGHLAVILSRPGSQDQAVHRDTPSLFGDDRFDARMPPVGVAMLIPFSSLDTHNGGTRVWPGTQDVAVEEEARAKPSVDVSLPLGASLIFDVRMLHGGIGNGSDHMRSIVYGAYHRPWFRDRDGFEHQAPVGITRAELERMPAEYRSLLSWRLDRYADRRLKMRVRGVASRLPDFVLRPMLRTLRRGK